MNEVAEQKLQTANIPDKKEKTNDLFLAADI